MVNSPLLRETVRELEGMSWLVTRRLNSKDHCPEMTYMDDEPSTVEYLMGTKAREPDPEGDWENSSLSGATTRGEEGAHKFPPDPPSLPGGVGDGECAGLLNLVRRNKKRPLACATPQKKPPPAAGARELMANPLKTGDGVRWGLGVRLRHEGKHWKGKPKARRADLPQLPKTGSRGGER